MSSPGSSSVCPASLTSVQSRFSVTSRRNDSLGARGRSRVLVLLCTASLALGAVFAALGAWLVLPYSALEIALLCAAFAWIGRHAADWERVDVDGDTVIVERDCGGVHSKSELNRFWTRVEQEQAGLSGRGCLLLCSAGRRIRFGADLAPGEREKVAGELRRALAAP